ncbi:hypothetical protein BVRB_023980, partial [Beta vulgaris subsp. vulgaris]
GPVAQPLTLWARPVELQWRGPASCNGAALLFQNLAMPRRYRPCDKEAASPIDLAIRKQRRLRTKINELDGIST